MTQKFLLTLFGLEGLTVSGRCNIIMRPVLLLLLSAPAAGRGVATASWQSVRFQDSCKSLIPKREPTCRILQVGSASLLGIITDLQDSASRFPSGN
jgi:hypothetical protein